MVAINNWYLIHTKAKQEQLALLHLQRQHYHCYLPKICVRKRKPEGYVWCTEIMFPRYLFIELNTETDHWSPIRSTRGVQQLVRFGMQPAKLPLELLQLIRQQESDSLAQAEASQQAQPTFTVGQPVQVVDGAFIGYEAIFQQTTGAKRAQVLLEISGRQNLIQLDIDSLEDSAA